MQTVEFNERLATIVDSMMPDEILRILNVILDESKSVPLNKYSQDFGKLIFNANANLKALSQDPANSTIIKSLGFDTIFYPDSLSAMITAVYSTTNTEDLRNQYKIYYRQFIGFRSLLMSVFTLQATVQHLLIEPKKENITTEEGPLEFEIVDRGNGIGMDRFESILKAVHTIHDTISRVLGVEGRLAIAYLDSGSNAIVTIKSDHRIVDSFKQLILQIWDKRKFGKHDKLERSLETATEAIAFIELINAKEKSGTLTHEDATRFKHAVFTETINLFEKGTNLKEVQTQPVLDNRTILMEAFAAKLIESGEQNPTPAQLLSQPGSPEPGETGGNPTEY